MKINIDTSILKKEANNIKDSADKYKNEISKVIATKNGIAGIWQGNDYNYFSSQMNSFTDELTNYYETLESYSEALQNYAEKHEILDDDYSGKSIELS